MFRSIWVLLFSFPQTKQKICQNCIRDNYPHGCAAKCLMSGLSRTTIVNSIVVLSRNAKNVPRKKIHRRIWALLQMKPPITRFAHIAKNNATENTKLIVRRLKQKKMASSRRVHSKSVSPGHKWRLNLTTRWGNLKRKRESVLTGEWHVKENVHFFIWRLLGLRIRKKPESHPQPSVLVIYGCLFVNLKNLVPRLVYLCYFRFFEGDQTFPKN